MASSGLQGADGDELQLLSTEEEQEGFAQPVLPEATTRGPCSARRVAAMTVSVATVALLLAVAAVATVAMLELTRAPTTRARAAAHPRELHELAASTLRRFSKVRRLRPAQSAESLEKPILKYQSVDEEGKPGVFLGKLDEAGTIVASDVELDTKNPSKMTFTVGPEVEGVGPLVSGNLRFRDNCTFGMCGTIRAGFVNMHSTLSGTWQTEGKTLDSTIHIRWIEPEMHVDQKLAWNPIEELIQATNPADTT